MQITIPNEFQPVGNIILDVQQVLKVQVVMTWVEG